MFRQGMHDLKVWPGVEGDGGEPTTTPGRTSSSLAEDQMGRLAKVQCVCGSENRVKNEREECMRGCGRTEDERKERDKMGGGERKQCVRWVKRETLRCKALSKH